MKTFNFDEIRDEIKQMREAAKGKCGPASTRMDSMFANMLNVVDESEKAEAVRLAEASKSVSKRRRSVTEEEVNRFLDLFPKENRDDVIKLMLNTRIAAMQVIIATKESTDRYYKSRLLVTEKRANPNLDIIVFDPKFAYFKEDDKGFIISFISRCFGKLKLIFSSSEMYVFAADFDDMSANLYNTRLCKNHLVVNLFSKFKRSKPKDFAMLDLSMNDAEVSDDLWNIILNNRDIVNYMMLAYVRKDYFSDNIKKRLQALYDSLPDSEKQSIVDKFEKDNAAALAEAAEKISESLCAAIDDWYVRSKNESNNNIYLISLEKLHDSLKKALTGGEDSANADKKGV